MANGGRVFLLALLGWIGFASPASAHHGYAAYDMTQTLTLTGTVTEVAFANPHSSLAFDVKDDKGNVTHWAIEFGQLRAVVAQGWTRETLKPGDEIEVPCVPQRTGSRGGSCGKKYVRGWPAVDVEIFSRAVVLACGEVKTSGNQVRAGKQFRPKQLRIK